MGTELGNPRKLTLSRFDEGTGEVTSYMTAQYNPTAIRRRLGSRWALVFGPGAMLPVPMYGGSSGETIQFELLLYGREKNFTEQYVQRQMAYLELLVAPAAGTAEGLADFHAPPIVLLQIGERSWFAVVEDVDFDEQAFDIDLNPTRVRARVRLSVVAIDSASAGTLFTGRSELAAKTGGQVVVTGGTL